MNCGLILHRGYKMEKKVCKFSDRCEHKKMSLVFCSLENCQPIENCMLHVLMQGIEDKKNHRYVEKRTTGGGLKWKKTV
jgi:hypothetical protein